MDKTKEQGKWSWLPSQMPGVARQLADKRRELGADWVNQCWRKGVVEQQPGWFFASEGALMVGTLGDDPEVLNLVKLGQAVPGSSMVLLKNKEAADGAN